MQSAIECSFVDFTWEAGLGEYVVLPCVPAKLDQNISTPGGGIQIITRQLLKLVIFMSWAVAPQNWKTGSSRAKCFQTMEKRDWNEVGYLCPFAFDHTRADAQMLKVYHWLVVSNIFFIFTWQNDPIWFIMYIFQMGWNHQLDHEL